MKLHIVILLFLTSGSCIAQNPKPSSGTVKRFESFPSKFVSPRNIDVWLPDGYDGKKKYAVLYMHDGQSLFDSTITWNKQEWGVDETLGKLMAAHKVRGCIVVGAWNTVLRHSEYFPQKPLSLSPKSNKTRLSRQTGQTTRRCSKRTYNQITIYDSWSTN